MQATYRERLEPAQRLAAERLFVDAVLDTLTSGQRNQLANYFRYEAPGEPTQRGYIVDLIEGRERLDGPAPTSKKEAQ
jgi:hypothetical protein